ncbi:outer membrane lipoprotein carrier protein LolA [Azospirillum baldaniorum]|uniref:Outer-membrane lipoprotein carrier protein n=1 Tax=Azospirillum baldaniorum TaxID=1064539 RepID=A0A9P1JNH5_9PROT|nr:outer membrane lipoprotein carrier protein LolA [Azospirillum baldaniorum]TWA80117.1 outer membrane lipoprotein-sorting protein [Azospirillum brasilense]AWJ88369.1 outer membrane lipoprotein carrier protein LolA [Azospirillum baldaniorum]NUB08968.1 outer membrane lipoprotein carrier protein LolA [Azospirillum baldaniorum]TWA68685.1 outer membrane lipoprotein-sorting protein [Azospirillum baldaniorum]CCC96719.1 outer-membrane lipoprotein carrier protein [Azospirillum baldaniorum]
MKIPFRRILAAAAVALSVTTAGAVLDPAQAAPRAAALSAQDQALVAQAESYLNGIGTLQSKFVQVAPNGHQTAGTFYLARPGRMRLEYDPPVKDFVVADGAFIFYWDGEMRQQSSAPIGSTLADFILRKNIRLSGDVTVTGVYQAPGLVEISLTETKDPGKGTLTLVFEDRPFQLRKWRVLDAQGLTTEVALMNPREGMQFDSKLFYFIEPSKGDYGRSN